MPAYIIVDITINDPTLYEEYKKMTPASIAAYGGRFIVRGGKTETLEGKWNPQRIAILEFPTMEIARNWWASEEYSQAKGLRQRIAFTNMLVVEGA